MNNAIKMTLAHSSVSRNPPKLALDSHPWRGKRKGIMISAHVTGERADLFVFGDDTKHERQNPKEGDAKRNP
jgi:hypothetical protein